MNKPQYLYHASSIHNLTRIVPQLLRVKDQQNGPLIFASTHTVENRMLSTSTWVS